MFALFHRRSGHRRMQVVRRTHNNGVEVLLLLKQLAEVTECRTATILAGTLLRAVIGVYDFLTRFGACNAPRDPQRMGHLSGRSVPHPTPPPTSAPDSPNPAP